MSALPAEPTTTGDLPQSTAEDASMTVEASLVPAVPGPPAAPDGNDAVASATGEESTAAAAAAADIAGATVANRGRGRGARRGTAAKRGSTAAAGAGRGRGKRKSEAAALAEDTGGTGVKPFAVDEPRKKRRAAQSAPRIVESDEETEDAPPAVAAPPPEVAPAVVDEPSASPLPVPATRKIKLKVGKRTSTVSPAPAVPDSAASAAAALVTAGLQPEKTAESVVSETTQPVQDQSSSELPVDASRIQVNGLQDLFAEDPPQTSAIGAEAIAASSDLNQTPKAATPAGVSADNSSKNSHAKEARSDSKLAKAGTPIGAGLSKAVTTKKSAAGIRPQPSVSKSESASETKVSGSPLPTKKRLPKAPATQSNTPLSHHSGRGAATAAPAQAPSGSFLDSLFADTIPQTEHERQLQREREEKTRKAEAAAKAAAAKAKKVREDADASKQASDAVASNVQPGSSHLVPASSKPPPITLKSLKRGITQLSGGGSVLSRLAGSEKTREQEIVKLRASAAKDQEELAKAGGFDLLSQGLEMAAFEAPFLHEWRSHQNAVFGGQGRRSAGTFELYTGSSAASEGDSTLALQSLPHPWTFGSAFAFSGLPAPVQAGDWR